MTQLFFAAVAADRLRRVALELAFEIAEALKQRRQRNGGNGNSTRRLAAVL